jgi:molybdopterin-guanine dinucleotide biosynthesis protein A
MLQWVIAQLRPHFDEIVVVAGAHDTPALPTTAGRVICDPQPFQGPVGALRRGLDFIRGDVAFACGCDLPFVRAQLAVTLCAMAAGVDAAIPRVNGRLQVLHAAYHKNCLAALRTMSEHGERSLQKLAALVRTRVIDEDEIRPYDPQLLSFFNVNTPAQYEEALRLQDPALP